MSVFNDWGFTQAELTVGGSKDYEAHELYLSFIYSLKVISFKKSLTHAMMRLLFTNNAWFPATMFLIK